MHREPHRSAPAGTHPAYYVPGAVGMALVGGSVAVSHVLVDAPLMTAQAIRYAAAAAVLILCARILGRAVPMPRRRDWPLLVLLAGSGLVLFNVALVRGAEHAEPAAIAVAVASVPVVLGLLGPLLESSSPSRRLLAAAATVTAGSVLVQGFGRTDAYGVGWAAVALACEAAFTLLAVPLLPRLGAWGVSVHSVLVGTAMFAVLALLTEGPTAAARIQRDQWVAIAYLAILVTAVAFVLWYATVARVGAASAGLLTGVAPVAAAGVGIVVTGDVPGAGVWVGVAVVAAGLALGLGRRRTTAPAQRDPQMRTGVGGPTPASTAASDG
ncbi:DMT family transporter [Mumia zhuanghuii]|uniref:EamA family transporter n=2 Tax=Mumia TaxID=1546255 RepID=A0ABW1QJA5_9ACTN|nr:MULTISPECIES: DMT family transporter [Mumia]KAA1419921.1 DMT family transporter [Mumia zhuanghuii]